MSDGFRRRIEMRTTGDSSAVVARASVEDDFHHFRVQVRCADQRIDSVEGWALRHPYTACPSAAAELKRLEGYAISDMSAAVYQMTQARIHCTHMLDLAGLAIAAAARKIARRTYDIAVPDRVDTITEPRISRDGCEVLRWRADMTSLLSPEPFAGVSYRIGFSEWAHSELERDDLEAALALRRALIISVGRTKDLDAQLHAVPTGFCYAQQPERAKSAARVRNSIREFNATPERLCEADQAWLTFRDEPPIRHVP